VSIGLTGRLTAHAHWPLSSLRFGGNWSAHGRYERSVPALVLSLISCRWSAYVD
jgi:hypothetical protein